MSSFFIKSYLILSFLLVAILASYRPISLDAFEIESVRPFANTANSLLVVFFAINISILISKLDIIFIRFNKTGLWYLLILFLMMMYLQISSAWNPSPIFASATAGFVQLLLFQLLYAITIVFIIEYVLRADLSVFVGYMIILLALTASLFAIQELLTYGLSWRTVSVMGDSSTFGAISALGVLSLLHMYATFRKNGLLFLLLAVWFGVFVVSSGSRNAQLCLLGCLALYLHYSGVYILTFWRVIFLTVITFVAVIIVFTNEALFSHFIREANAPDEHSRIFIWSVVVELYSEANSFNKAFGYGLGFLRDNFRSAHNTFLQLLIEFGYVFLVAFFLLISMLLRRLHLKSKTNRHVLFLFLMVIFCLLFSISLYVLFSPTFSFLNLLMFLAISSFLTGSRCSNKITFISNER